MVRITLDFIAPIPVGHHVTAIPLEVQSILDFSGGWTPSRNMIVCDDVTRIVYTNRGVGTEAMSYESLTVDPSSRMRISQSAAPVRGTVTACVVRSDNGDAVRQETIITITPDPVGYR